MKAQSNLLPKVLLEVVCWILESWVLTLKLYLPCLSAIIQPEGTLTRRDRLLSEVPLNPAQWVWVVLVSQVLENKGESLYLSLVKLFREILLPGNHPG